MPIIASPVNGIHFEMKDPENGFFVSYGDIENLQKHILNILDNSKLADKISKNNIKKAKDHDWDIIYKRYMKEYEALLKNK